MLPVHPLFSDAAPGDTVVGNSGKGGGRRSRDDLRALIIGLLSEQDEMSANEMSAALGYKKPTDTFREVVNELIDSGDAAYLYPDKPRSRNQKIHLAKRPGPVGQ